MNQKKLYLRVVLATDEGFLFALCLLFGSWLAFCRFGFWFVTICQPAACRVFSFQFLAVCTCCEMLVVFCALRACLW